MELLRRLKNAILNGFLQITEPFVYLLSRIYRKRVKYSMVRPVKNFLNGGSHMAGKGYFQICFANTVFHKRAMLQLFCAESTENTLDILSYLESTMGPP